MATAAPAVQRESDISDTGRDLAGKYLTFRIGEEEFGIGILKVQQIIQMQHITVVPQMPSHVRGVINLRGRIVPIVDLRVRFGMARAEDAGSACIVVVQVQRDGHEVTMGVVIDEVREVLEIKADEIEGAPSFGNTVDTDTVMGIGKTGKNVKILLDIDRVVSAEDIGELRKLAQAPAEA